jgi:DNA topoisomerase-1
METLRVVSHELNNTPAVCRRSYVHPAVVSSYEAGELPETWRAGPARGSKWTTRDERRLLRFLEGLGETCG